MSPLSGDPLHAGQGLASRVRALRTRATQLSTIRDQVAADVVAREAEVKSLTARTEKLTLCAELLRTLLDRLVEKQVKVVEDIGTQGLQSVFPDLDLVCETEVAPKYNKISVEIFFRQRGGLPVRGKPLDSFGGGPASVLSCILRVLAVCRLKLWPVLLLDESLSAVSSEYVENTAKFLSLMTTQFGADVLLVTHKTAFLEHAKRAYQCSEVVEEDGSRHLELRRTK